MLDVFTPLVVKYNANRFIIRIARSAAPSSSAASPTVLPRRGVSSSEAKYIR
jgi:hypothetical protein